MSKENLNLLNLFKEKKYSEIIFKIEQIKKEEINPSLLNLLGVCRMLSTNSIETIKLAIEDFKKSYYLEKDKTKTKDTIKNLINASSTLFDKEYIKNERNLGSDFFEEIDLIYQQNKQIFDNDENLLKAISKVMKRTSDAKSTIQYLRKILNLHSDPDTIASYNFFNNYIFDWKQSDYYQNSKKINQKLPIFSSGELINLKFSKKEKINIGFVSSDIRSKHSITYFLKTVLLFYNQEKFKIYLYHNHNLINDPSTIELNNFVSNFSYVNTLKDTEVINKIREDEIDIIIDLNGFSSNHRLALFKNRLAPIQISWCGYTNTTGLDEMDYLLADRNLIRPEEEKYYSEKIIYLPNIWNCHSGYPYERSENLMPMETNNYITFGSFNNFRKINDEVIETWSSILKTVKNSKLLLKTSIATSKEFYQKKFDDYGVLKSITFSDYNKSFKDHLNEYKKIDIALDTFPWNGVTTTFESIWMNVPVLVLEGFNFSSRCGSSINKNLKLLNLIAKNKEEYISKAVTLAQDKNKLYEIRKNIFEDALDSSLFNKEKFSNEFFISLEKIFNKRLANKL